MPVPAEATIALGEVIGSAQEGLLALAVGTGLQVKQVLMEESLTAVCGPRDKHNATGSATGTSPRPDRSPSAAGGCRWSGRGSGPSTGPGSCRWRRMS